MFVVALAALETSVEDEAPALARDLGTTAYETRLQLMAGIPSVVLVTPSLERALDVLGSLRARGHGAVACDTHAVVPAASMVAIRRYRLEDGALVLDPADGARAGGDRLPFAEIRALIRATHRTTHETREQVKEVKFRPGAALATGGLVLTKKTTKEVRSTIEEREQVLYVFGAGRTPWLLRETTAQNTGLGEAMRPTRIENFMAAVRALREFAPHAAYDERLLSANRIPEIRGEPGEARGSDPMTRGIDLMAHVLALWLLRGLGEESVDRLRP
jgi:hypothetical protein